VKHNNNNDDDRGVIWQKYLILVSVSDIDYWSIIIELGQELVHWKVQKTTDLDR